MIWINLNINEFLLSSYLTYILVYLYKYFDIWDNYDNFLIELTQTKIIFKLNKLLNKNTITIRKYK